MSKTITCDLCKKVLGIEVNKGMWSISTTDYSPRSFGEYNDFGIMPDLKVIVDICSECSNKIVDAQNKAIEEIRNLSTPS